MEYFLVSNVDIGSFNSGCQRKADEGFVPYGPHKTTPLDSHHGPVLFTQCFIKYEEGEETPPLEHFDDELFS